MRGKAFGFVALLCTTWVTVRVGFTLITDGAKQVTARQYTSANAIAQPVTQLVRGRLLGNMAAKTKSAADIKKGRVAALLPESIEPLYVDSKQTIYKFGGDWVPDEKTPYPISSALVEPPKKRGSMRPIQIYAYGFWRQGDTAPGVLGNGQYGGSQSALLVTVPLLRHKGYGSVTPVSFVGRASVAHNAPREREWATGLLWHPSNRFPAQLSIEQRFRPDRPDVVAAFVSGGHEGASLPLGFALDGYGQAGFVTGKSGGAFADAQLHALKNLARNEGFSLNAGAGAWAGGQGNIMRVDMGPSVRANLQAGAASLRLDASWRFRVAGKATPGDGPTVTLSTSF